MIHCSREALASEGVRVEGVRAEALTAEGISSEDLRVLIHYFINSLIQCFKVKTVRPLNVRPSQVRG
jgi:hypothetical protein